MIRRAERADADAVLAATARTPGLGPRVWAKWCIQGENPRYPGDFYLWGPKGKIWLCAAKQIFPLSGKRRPQEGGDRRRRGGQADGTPCLLFLDGAEGTLCGPKTAGGPLEEELLAFLDFLRVQKLRTIGWLPPGRRDTNNTPLLVAKGPLRTGPGAAAALDAADIVEFPPAAGVCAVLAGAGLLPEDTQTQSDFASDYNTRRNHGVALVAGLKLDGRLVATAGAYAIAPGEAYLSSVATLPEYRGRGYAAALLAHLQRALPGRMLSLFSVSQSMGFYTRLGFQPWPEKRIDVQFIMHHEL